MWDFYKNQCKNHIFSHVSLTCLNLGNFTPMDKLALYFYFIFLVIKLALYLPLDLLRTSPLDTSMSGRGLIVLFNSIMYSI